MKKFLVFVVFLFLFAPMKVSADAAGVVVTMAGVNEANKLKDNSTFGDFFVPKGGVNLEQIMLVTNKNMNRGGAVKVHVVIVYERELVSEFMKMSATQYFQRVDQLIKDYSDKMKIFAWELVAKERITPWIDIKYPVDHMVPLAAFIFADYSSAGDHRIRIPPSYKKIKITFETNDLNVDYKSSDKNYNEDNNEDVDNYI